MTLIECNVVLSNVMYKCEGPFHAMGSFWLDSMILGSLCVMVSWLLHPPSYDLPVFFRLPVPLVQACFLVPGMHCRELDLWVLWLHTFWLAVLPTRVFYLAVATNKRGWLPCDKLSMLCRWNDNPCPHIRNLSAFRFELQNMFVLVLKLKCWSYCSAGRWVDPALGFAVGWVRHR